MSDGIEVHSTHALSDLKSAMEQVAMRVRNATAESGLIVSSLERRFDAVEDRAVQRLRTARRAQAAASEDDERSAEADVEEAEGHLRDVRRAIGEAGRAFARLQRCEAAASAAAIHSGQAGAAYLGRKIAELGDYNAVTLGSVYTDRPDASHLGQASPPAAASQADRPPSKEELEGCVLPIGWKWIALDDIDTSLAPGESLTFEGDSRRQLESRFAQLWRDILPNVDRNRGAAADLFTADDQKRGIFDGSGKVGAFEAFFSTGAPIHLQRGRGASRYSIDNGRHRIDVARSLGWPAVPARTSEL